MPNPLFRPPKDLIKEWPEVFDGIYMNTFPIEYLELIHLEFVNGGIWQIDLKEQLSDSSEEKVTSRILDILDELHDDIHRVNFKIDINRLKKDAYSSSSSIL
jgi:hypothetical protein